MSLIAPTLQAFFTERLTQQRNASPYTVAAYRNCFRLLLQFVHDRRRKEPSQLAFDDLSATVVAEFLQHLENERGNSICSRNARLAAIHSFFKFAAYRHPEHAELIQRVLAIPPKRFERAEITHLDRNEIVALLGAPDRDTWHGRRDHALLLVAIQTGFRLSELTALRVEDAHLGGGAHLRCVGKGRKSRCTPLNSQTVNVLKGWLRERGGTPAGALFPTRRGTRLSADAVANLVARHTQAAALSCHSLKRRRSLLTSFATPTPCSYFRAALTPPPSHSGWGMRAYGRPTSISTPTCRSRRELWGGWRLPRPSPVATGRRTP
jgi:integrase/recombinase XerD